MKLIDIKNLTFEYFRRDTEGNVEEIVEALKDVSLDVKQGEFIAILGRNGSGKSTLAKHINALLLPGEGEVIVDGMDTSNGELRLKIRQTAGMVFQNPDNQIVANLVEEDVAFGPENLGVPTENIWNRVNDALNVTGMEEYRNQSPNHLSGGQKQRVAIAGVLAMEPKCIIFDEATAMLDPQGRRQMIEAAKRLQDEKGISIILITHHMDEVILADKVFVMKDGMVMDQGTPEQIFAKKELLEECGLCLPAFYQYLYFLVGQGILSKEECEGVRNKKELSKLLCKKYKGIGRKTASDGIYERSSSGDKAPQNDTQTPKTEGILLNHVSYVYNKGFSDERIALKDVSLKIGKGEFVAVIGHTGSGKSTLMQHLNGLYLPMEGNVYFNGQDITDKDFSLKKLRQKVGLVFQYPEYQLFAETVEKDVCFGPENMDISKVEAQKRAYEAIKAVGLPDTIYDNSPLQLSGGQKRRVAIAGVLAMQPEYLVLDEPTAGLDPFSAEALLSMLKELQEKKGITVVIVSHSMEEVAEYAERIVVMEHGEKRMDGTVFEVFEQAEALEKMGLSVPMGMEILYGLKNVGMDVDTTKHRKMDICGELLKLKDE
ncbi:MAG: energy-coupling factor transporter ATPase [Clostridiales bacterium]|nr:energy-coupling factor transporter ATPase [Clostridiales bacterium]